jgi:hypothetical protein
MTTGEVIAYLWGYMVGRYGATAPGAPGVPIWPADPPLDVTITK